MFDKFWGFFESLLLSKLKLYYKVSIKKRVHRGLIVIMWNKYIQNSQSFYKTQARNISKENFENMKVIDCDFSTKSVPK